MLDVQELDGRKEVANMLLKGADVIIADEAHILKVCINAPLLLNDLI